MALSRMRLRLARGRRRAVRGRGLFREEIMLSGFIVLTSEMTMASYQGMASAVPYFVSKIGLRTHGAQLPRGVRLLCSCAVPARDLTFRYLAARLKPCSDTNLLCKKI